MRIFALIPDEYIREAEAGPGLSFDCRVSLAKNEASELTLILKVKGDRGKTKNGTQYISELIRDEPSVLINDNLNVSKEQTT